MEIVLGKKPITKVDNTFDDSDYIKVKSYNHKYYISKSDILALLSSTNDEYATVEQTQVLVDEELADYTKTDDMITMMDNKFKSYVTSDELAQLIKNLDVAKNVVKALETVYTLEDYSVVGTFEFKADGNTEYTIDASTLETQSKAIVNDYARFLGELHKVGVECIVYNGTEYTWDEFGTLKGSNFKSINGVTLMSVITADLMKDKTSVVELNDTTIDILIDGKPVSTHICVK